MLTKEQMDRLKAMMENLALGIATPEEQEMALEKIHEAAFVFEAVGLMQQPAPPEVHALFHWAGEKAKEVTVAMREVLKRSFN
jgi:hypothetical protein